MLVNVNHELWCHAIFPLESAFYGLTDVRIQEIESDTSHKAGEEEENGNWRWCGNTSLRARHDVDRKKGRIRRKEEKKKRRTNDYLDRGGLSHRHQDVKGYSALLS
jgi:hypothetical protein